MKSINEYLLSRKNIKQINYSSLERFIMYLKSNINYSSAIETIDDLFNNCKNLLKNYNELNDLFGFLNDMIDKYKESNLELYVNRLNKPVDKSNALTKYDIVFKFGTNLFSITFWENKTYIGTTFTGQYTSTIDYNKRTLRNFNTYDFYNYSKEINDENIEIMIYCIEKWVNNIK